LADILSQPVKPSPATTPQTGGTLRLFFIDHLRAALVTLVVLHHLAVIYGGVPAFYYFEQPTSELAGLVALIFVLFNQAWFMGALFLLAGYFTPGSFDRKGAASFIKARLLRLGVPFLFFYFILGPLATVGYFEMPASVTGITDPITWAAYPYLLGMGPMWFVGMLLIFSFGYAAWRRLKPGQVSTPTGEASLPGPLWIGGFIVALALASYLMRIFIPLGEFFLQFPTLSYFPQYLSFFVLGIAASRRNWLRRLTRFNGPGRFWHGAGRDDPVVSGCAA
jgi:glucan biosynthesis protein C